MRKLIAGIAEFREKLLPRYAERFRALASGQAPDTLMIACSDSRIVPDLLASTHPGDLFTVRNVGNLVPPANAEGVSTGDVSEASAIEYAVLVLGVRNIVVCGHSSCGAMKAALAQKARPDTPNLAEWLHHTDAACLKLHRQGALDRALPRDDQLSQVNVLVQLEHLTTYSIVREGLANRTLRLAGWWFDVATGEMYSYEPGSRSFEVIDGSVAGRIIARIDGD
jgi:carbonic anhydrase